MRSHNDSGPLALKIPKENDGNFRTILRNTLNNIKELLEIRSKASKNAHYLSPTTQNEIIICCQNVILNKLVSDVNKSECFSILADETADISGIEQFSLSIRYLKENNIMESFLLFVPVISTTGLNLSETIINTLKSIGINLNYLKSHGYDGTACMSGKFNGVQQLI